MMLKSLKNYFEFTAKERSGVYILMMLVMLLPILPFVYPFVSAKTVFDETRLNRSLKVLAIQKQSFNKITASKPGQNQQSGGQKMQATVFYFDPNTLNTEGWLRLGIKEKTALTIQKYVSKGGRFKKAGDLEKIWGMNQADLERLIPYVSIPGEPKPSYNSPLSGNKYAEKRVLQKVDINLADTSIFIALPGIGPGFARRIVNFRTKLGGFYAVEQVAETYGLPDSTFQKVKPYLIVKPGDVIKININAATLDELKTHPYIRYNLANVIVNFRSQHGNYQTVEDIKKIMILTDEAYEKLAPYLSVQ